MPIRLKCPHCKKGLAINDKMAGKKVLCPACKKPFSVPAAPADKPPPPAPPPPIEFNCEYCDTRLKFDADMGGKKAPCTNPECRRIIKVPMPKIERPKDWREVSKG